MRRWFLIALLLAASIAQAQDYQKRSLHQPFAYIAVGEQFQNFFREKNAAGDELAAVHRPMGTTVEDVTLDVALSLYKGFGVAYNTSAAPMYYDRLNAIGIVYTHSLMLSPGTRRGIYFDGFLQYMGGTIGLGRHYGSPSTDTRDFFFLESRSTAARGLLLSAQLRLRVFLGASFILKGSYYACAPAAVSETYADTRLPGGTGVNRSVYNFSYVSFSAALGFTLYAPDRKFPWWKHFNAEAN